MIPAILVIEIFVIVTVLSSNCYPIIIVFMKINFEEMQVYDFSNLNLHEESNNNCYSCDECDGCDGHKGH